MACTVLLLLAAGAVCASQPVSILQYGAIPFNDTWDASLANGRALLDAFSAANNAGVGASRAVLIPAGQNFTIVPADVITGLNNVTLLLEGCLIANTGNISGWPNVSESGYGIDGSALDVVFIANSSNVRIQSVGYTGLIDGQGFPWWVYVSANNPDNRPNLVGMKHVVNVSIQGLRMVNSPAYHLAIQDGLHIDIQDSSVWVNVEQQQMILREAGHTWSVPSSLLSHGHGHTPGRALEALEEAADAFTFPLNTDGMDLWARDVYIRNVSIENFDDTVCVKPLNSAMGVVAGPCTQDWLVEDVHIKLGVGLSIGSVPPNTAVACIRNITFRNAVLESPIKGIYVKPNPGTEGSGIIDKITYENVSMTSPIWWGIYVGTQQQDQPGGGADTGCSFFYPLPNTTCPTQPRVPVTNLVLRNVHSTGALLSPGLLRCADTTGTNYTPCAGWVFDNVSMSSVTNWPVGSNYLCENIEGVWTGGSNPIPNCTVVPAQ